MANGGTGIEAQTALLTGKQLFTPFEQRIRALGLSEMATENLLMNVENFRVSYDSGVKMANPQRATALGGAFVNAVNGLAGMVDYGRETKPDARQNVEQIMNDLLIAGTAAFAALAKPAPAVAPVEVAAAPVHTFKVQGLHELAAKAQNLGASGDLQGMVVEALVQVDKAVTHLRDAGDEAGQDHAVEAYAQYERTAKQIARADYEDPRGDIRLEIKNILDAALSPKAEWGTDLLIINQLHTEATTSELALVDDASPVGGTTGNFRPEKPAAPVVAEVAQPTVQRVDITHDFKMDGLRDLAARAQTLNIEPELKVQVITAMAHLDDVARHIRDGRNEGSQQQAIDAYDKFQKVAKTLASQDYGFGSKSDAPSVRDILAQAVRGTKDGDNPAFAQPWALDMMIARNLHMEQGMSELKMLDLDEGTAEKAQKAMAELDALEKAGAADMEQSTRDAAAQSADKGNEGGTAAARIVEASEDSPEQSVSAFGVVSIDVKKMAQPNGIDWEVVGETIVADDVQPAKTQAFVKAAEPTKAAVEDRDKRDKINTYLRTNPYARLEKALVGLNREMEGTPLAKDLRVALSCVRSLLKDDLTLKQSNPGHVTLKKMRQHTKEYAVRLDEYMNKVLESKELKDFQEERNKSNLKKHLRSLHEPAMRHADRLQKSMRTSSISRAFSSVAAVFSKFFHHAPAAEQSVGAPVAEKKNAVTMKVD